MRGKREYQKLRRYHKYCRSAHHSAAPVTVLSETESKHTSGYDTCEARPYDSFVWH